MLSLSDPRVQSYILYSGVLAAKMTAMTYITVRQRVAKEAFANDEDAYAVNGKVNFNDPDVERWRRCHLNDVENIPLFWMVGGLYLTTNPEVATAQLMFRAFAASRILHTVVYAIKPLPQPTRAIVFGVGGLATIYMAVKVIMHYSGAW